MSSSTTSSLIADRKESYSRSGSPSSYRPRCRCEALWSCIEPHGIAGSISDGSPRGGVADLGQSKCEDLLSSRAQCRRSCEASRRRTRFESSVPPRHEYVILETLMCAAGLVVTRERLEGTLRQRETSALGRSLDVHVAHLRNKIGRALPIRTAEARAISSRASHQSRPPRAILLYIT